MQNVTPDGQDGSETCVLTDPEPLRRVLVQVVADPGCYVARVDPQEPLVIESKGLFGRTRRDEVAVGAEVAYLVGADGAGRFQGSVMHPDGWPTVSGGVPTPPGARISVAERSFFVVEFDPAASPARVAQEVMALVALVFRTDLGPTWTVTLAEV